MNESMLTDITETSGLYYYLTMKGFERTELQKNKKKSRKLTNPEKIELHTLLKSDIDNRLSFINLKKHITPKSIKINSYDDLYQFFAKVDLFTLLPHVELLDTYQPCTLLEGNDSWISKNHNGHFRYFSKAKNQLTISFDLIDLLEIYYGCSTSEAIEKAVADFKINFMEEVWFNQQNKKYLSNLTIIHSAKHSIQPTYPHLFDLIKKHLKVLETLNVIGNINIKKQEFSYKNENLFFASTSYIADFLNDYTVATTNKVINLLAVLGIIEKVHEDNIPSHLIYESKMIAEKRNLGNIISYYIIPNLKDIVEEAEKRAIILNQTSTSYSNINRTRIAYIFGEQFAKKIYVQEVQKNKNKAVLTTGIQKTLEKEILKQLKKKGYVSKKAIIKKSIRGTTIKERELEINKIWKAIMLEFELKYIKPTAEMKAKFRLKNSEYILVHKCL